ncbi:SURF4-domain-containing protein, partial [Rhizoclosmatium globosum]
QIERVIDSASTTIKPHMPLIARFLIIATFYEDSLRLWTQWDDQSKFLKGYRGFSSTTADLFLALNILTMTTSSTLLLLKKHTASASITLISVIFAQSLAYGILFDVSFIFRMLSVCGGLTLLLAEKALSESKEWRNVQFGSMGKTGQATYFQLSGRVLFLFLFLSFLFGGDGTLTPLRILVVLSCFIACTAVALGFQSRWSTTALTGVVILANVVLNGWWWLPKDHPRRDLERYDFFQNLSIIGGLLLLNHVGPGSLSVDESKKNM